MDLVLLFFPFSFLFKKNVFLYFCFLALTSEFNCFLRSRCSMEMWCPDDTRRDSWDGVGPPAWGRACFNSPEWSGGSSPVKTEPLQIVLLLLLFQTRSFRLNVNVNKTLRRQQTLRIYCAGALDDEELFIIEGSENWRSTPDDLEECEKWPKKAEKPLHRRHILHNRQPKC